FSDYFTSSSAVYTNNYTSSFLTTTASLIRPTAATAQLQARLQFQPMPELPPHHLATPAPTTYQAVGPAKQPLTLTTTPHWTVPPLAAHPTFLLTVDCRIRSAPTRTTSPVATLRRQLLRRCRPAPQRLITSTRTPTL